MASASASVNTDSGSGMGIGYLLLLALGIFAAVKFWRLNHEAQQIDNKVGVAKSGVSFFCNLAVSNRPAQVLAAQPCNCDQVTQTGYAPAFGAKENMPSLSQEYFS